MRKETSTNTLNEKLINDTCGMACSLSIIGGRWKPAIYVAWFMEKCAIVI